MHSPSNTAAVASALAKRSCSCQWRNSPLPATKRRIIGLIAEECWCARNTPRTLAFAPAEASSTIRVPDLPYTNPRPSM
ncbi:MAG TPA: hypothetical protein EYG44_01130 [Verrucomicrobia bacterium]|nr:hypothetical protein [Verrucomicrobiota bacterium]